MEFDRGEGRKFIRDTRLIHRFHQIGFDLNGFSNDLISDGGRKHFPKAFSYLTL